MDADKRRLMAAKRRKKRKDKLVTPVRSSGATGQASLDKKSHCFAKRAKRNLIRRLRRLTQI